MRELKCVLVSRDKYGLLICSNSYHRQEKDVFYRYNWNLSKICRLNEHKYSTKPEYGRYFWFRLYKKERKKNRNFGVLASIIHMRISENAIEDLYVTVILVDDQFIMIFKVLNRFADHFRLR